jgi:hypothetical protein
MTQQDFTQRGSRAWKNRGNNTEEARLTNICFPLKQKLAAVALKVVAFSGRGH